jgi:hypothetical protein
MKITEKRIIVSIIVLVIGYYLVNRFFLKSKPKEVPTTQDIATELEGMKNNALNSGTFELYRSENSTGHTIAGTILEQVVDIITAVLERSEVAKVVDTIIQSKEDADNVAIMIEEVGKDITESIKNLNGDILVAENVTRHIAPATKASIMSELAKTDIWYPILIRFMENHSDKEPFSRMPEDQKNKFKNASPSTIEEVRQELQNGLDNIFDRIIPRN